MKKILVASVIFTGCVFPSTRKINPSQIYQGYPCGTHCQSFQTGFDRAQKEQLQTNLDCATFPKDQVIGCQAAVLENMRGKENFTDLTIE